MPTRHVPQSAEPKNFFATMRERAPAYPELPLNCSSTRWRLLGDRVVVPAKCWLSESNGAAVFQIEETILPASRRVTGMLSIARAAHEC
jgi:hypothetical protein